MSPEASLGSQSRLNSHKYTQVRGSSPLSPSPLAPYLNPGWPGGVQEGGPAAWTGRGLMALRPQAAPPAMPAISSPHSFPPPSQDSRQEGLPQHREGKWGGVARRPGIEEASCRPTTPPPPHSCTSLEPRWKHTCESGQVQRAGQLRCPRRLQRQGPGWGLQGAGPGSPPNLTIINLG